MSVSPSPERRNLPALGRAEKDVESNVARHVDSQEEIRGDVDSSAAGQPSTIPDRIGPYRILREVGAGGMGTVYLSEDRNGNRLAIKVPRPDCVADELSVKRFYREARSAGRVSHPSLCTVRDVGEHGAGYYLAMDWIEGTTLAHLIDQRGVPALPQSLNLVATLADALQAAHDAGIVHRDLKPSNIMLRPDGQPVIIDFGTAKRFDNSETLLTLTGSIVGTPGYMAPEQVTSAVGEVGPASDVYALGILMYELITGAPPFSGNFATVLGSIVAEPPASLVVHCPGIDPNLEAICLKALAKNPAERFASAREFGASITAYLRDGTGPIDESPSVSAAPSLPSSAAPSPDERGLLRRWRDTLFGNR